MPIPSVLKLSAGDALRGVIRSHRVRCLLGIDVRGLAAFRIALGVLLLCHLVQRSYAIEAHFTDAGVLPRAVWLERFGRWGVSLHTLHGSSGFIVIMFLIAAVLATMLLIGHRTRIATVGSWMMLISLNQRNPVILNSGDVLLGVLLFWSMFLPLGARWSADGRLHTPRPQVHQKPFLSVATVALLIQVALIYVMTAVYKRSTEWQTEGTALYYALNIDQLTTPLGQWIAEQRSLLRPMTLATFYLEKYGAFLAFVPVAISLFRMLTVSLFIGFHAGIAMTMEIGLFPYICMAAWIPFLPPWFWDRFESVGRRWGMGTSPRWPMVRPAGPDAQPPEFRHLSRRRTSEALAAAALGLVICINIDTMPRRPIRIPPTMHSIAALLQVQQPWSMFSPVPLKEDGWYVVEATLKDGAEVDLFRGGQSVDWDKPALVSADYPTEPWRKYMLNLWTPEFRDHVQHFAGYLRREWDTSHSPEERVAELRVYFMREVTLPDHRTAPVSRELMYEWTDRGVDRVVPYSQSPLL